MLPNRLKLQATHIGDISFSSNFILHDVLFVPSFKYNLLSVTKLCASLNCDIVFSASNRFIQDTLSKKKIGSIEVQNGLYHLNISDFANNKDNGMFCGMTVKCNSDNVWHYRLGHLSNARLAILNKQFLIYLPLLIFFVILVLRQSKLNFLFMFLTLLLYNLLI